MSRLNDRQQKFVDEYLVDLNATQAAIRAGYSAKTAEQIGYKLVQKSSVQEAIQKAVKRRQQRTEITQDRVLKELANIAFANGADFAKIISVRGIPRVVLTVTDTLPPEKRAAISGIEETQCGVKVKTYDKTKALELLGKHLGLFDAKAPEADNEPVNLLQAIVDGSREDMSTDDLPEVE